MKKILGFAAGVILCLPLVGVTTMVADAETTVGAMALKLAESMELTAPDGGFDAKSAVVALSEAGIVIDGDVNARLVEGDVVDTLNQLGLNLTTSTPGATVAASRLDDVISAFKTQPFSSVEATKTKTKTKKVKGSPK